MHLDVQPPAAQPAWWPQRSLRGVASRHVQLWRVYLQGLSVNNVKLLADQHFNFMDADGTPRLWTVILAENGLCKTTLLQLIALAASGPVLSRQLLSDPNELPNANRHVSARFSADFRLPRSAEPLTVELQTRADSRLLAGNSGAQTVDSLRALETPGAFAVGYGVGRYLPEPGEVAVPADLTVDRVEGLFRPQHKLLGVDFYEALRSAGRQGRSAQLARTYSKRIRSVLLSTDETGERLLPALNTVELRGNSGVSRMNRLLESRRFEIAIGDELYRLKPSLLSQGYQSMIAWICDLLGHAFLDTGADVDPQHLEGLVLLDEIDLHLHPAWQRVLVPTLARAFPKLQFVVTTHSPLVVTGVDAKSVIRLGLQDGRIQQLEPLPEPGLADAAALLSSYFGVARAGRPALVAAETEYLQLAALHRASPRRHELQELLDPYWAGEVALEGDVD